MRMRIATALYRVLLLLFPEPFRRRFAASMEATFVQVAERIGPLRALGREVVDVVPRALAERVRRQSGPPQRQREGKANPMESLWKDVIYAWRALVRSPVAVAVSVVSLALGIGANAAIFTMVDGVLVKPMPVRSPEELVTVYATRGTERSPLSFSYPNFEDLRATTDVFADVVGFQGAPLATDFGNGEPELVWSEVVTESYFEGLGVTLQGRGFERDENDVAVFSHALAVRRYGLAESALGKTVTVNGRELTIVGVAGPGFTGAKLLGFTPELWLPIRTAEFVWRGLENRLTSRFGGFLNVRARLAPGVTLDEARAALDIVATRLEAEHPEDNRDWRLHAMPGGRKTEPFLTVMVGNALPVATAVLFTVVGIVLLIACANVASLQLARSVSRRKELAVRVSLGASRGRVVRQLLFESLLLSAGGGALGLVIGKLILDGAMSLHPVLDYSVDYGVGLDARVLAFTAAVAIASGLIAGLLPALRTAKTDVNRSLREATPDRSVSQRRRWIVVPQLALSLVALVCAGLLVQSFRNVLDLSPGFDPERLLLASVNLELQGYDDEGSGQFHRDVLDRLRARPEVAGASLASPLPLDAYTNGGRVYPDYARFDGEDENEGAFAFSSTVGDGYFETMVTPIVDGRPFDEGDTAKTKPVAIVNETLARRFWPEDSAVGRSFRPREGGDPIEIIGVARDGKYITLGEEPRSYVFFPLSQNRSPQVTLIVRSHGDPAGFESELRAVVRGLDPTLPVFGVKTMDQFLGRTTGGALALASAVSFFAGSALVLTVIGVYGLMSFLVTEKRRDIGIRMALGAGSADVLLLFVKEALSIIAVGVAIGLPLAWASTRFVSNLLVGMEGSHIGALVLVSLALGLVALAGSFFPSQRAARVNPIVTLRCD